MAETVFEYLHRSKAGFTPATFRTCEGDLILTINALIDYAGICDRKASEMEQGFESASLRYYAKRYREIADKWAEESDLTGKRLLRPARKRSSTRRRMTISARMR